MFIYPKRTPNLPCRHGWLFLQSEWGPIQGYRETLVDQDRKWGRTPVLAEGMAGPITGHDSSLSSNAPSCGLPGPTVVGHLLWPKGREKA